MKTQKMAPNHSRHRVTTRGFSSLFPHFDFSGGQRVSELKRTRLFSSQMGWLPGAWSSEKIDSLNIDAVLPLGLTAKYMRWHPRLKRWL